MSWLPTFLFWGGIAASIPIVLHFFFRSRFRVVQWAAMEFLLKSVQETSRRLKFQELLLLLLRILVFTLLALILALTLWRVTTSWGGSGAVDAVLLLDVSGSMNAKEGTRTRLDLARDAALEIVNSLPPASTVQVVLATDRARLAGPRQPANLDQARELLQQIAISNRPTDFLAGLEKANEILRSGFSPNREVYLISDMQKQGLMQSASLRSAMDTFEREKTRFYAVHCGTQTPVNAAIEGILPQSGILHTGTRASFAVLVRNTTNQPVRDLKVSLKLMGQEKGEDTRVLPVLQPDELKPVPLSVELKQGGYQVLSATIEPDDLAVDNRYEQVIQVHEQVRVLIVDGAPNRENPDRSPSHYLATALTPVSESARDRYFIKTRLTTPRQATPVQLSDRDVVILVNVPLRPRVANEAGNLSAEFLDELHRFVREGKGLMIFAGSQVVPTDYNEELLTKRPLLPLRLGDPVPPQQDEKIRFVADPASIKPQGLLASFRENPQARILSGIGVMQYLDTKDPTQDEKDQGTVQVAMNFSSGRPALATRLVERGKVLLCTTSADTSWNDWPLLGHIYLPMIHESLADLLQSDVQGFNRRVGQPLVWVPTATNQDRDHLLTPPSGDETRLGLPRGDDGKAAYLVENTDRAGVYRIEPENREDPERITNLDQDVKRDPGVVFAVTSEIGESGNLEPGTPGDVDEGMGVKVTHLNAAQGDLKGQLADRRSQEWTGLLVLVLALLLGESALAWYCGRAW